MLAIAVVLAAHAADLPAPGDKTGYRVLVTASGGGLHDWAARGGLTYAASSRLLVQTGLSRAEGDLEVVEGIVDDDGSTALVERKAGWRGDAGAAWNLRGNGLQGFGPMARVGLQRVQYEPRDMSLDPMTRADVVGGAWARWVGHPGISVGAELGVSSTVCCDLQTDQARVGPLALFEVGWALGPGPDPADVVAQLSSEEQRRRRRQTRTLGWVIAGTVGATAVATAYGVGTYDSPGMNMTINWAQ
jgi:hypothetical protein